MLASSSIAYLLLIALSMSASVALILPRIAAAEQENENEDGGRGGNVSFGNGGIPDLILLATILSIVGVGGYSGYKILSIRRKIKLKSKAA